MEFKESLKSDLKGKIINYQNVDLYVVDQFEFEDKNYLYTVNMQCIEEKTEVTFLRKIQGEEYEHILDKELLKKLFLAVSGRMLDNEITKLINEKKSE